MNAQILRKTYGRAAEIPGWDLRLSYQVKCAELVQNILS